MDEADRSFPDSNIQNANHNRFIQLLAETYGLSSNDVDMDQMTEHLAEGESPEELVAWLGDKYDLTPIDQATRVIDF